MSRPLNLKGISRSRVGDVLVANTILEPSTPDIAAKLRNSLVVQESWKKWAVINRTGFRS